MREKKQQVGKEEEVKEGSYLLIMIRVEAVGGINDQCQYLSLTLHLWVNL